MLQIGSNYKIKVKNWAFTKAFKDNNLNWTFDSSDQRSFEELSDEMFLYLDCQVINDIICVIFLCSNQQIICTWDGILEYCTLVC